MIRKRRNGLQVQVYAGRNPLTGRKRWVSRQVPHPGPAHPAHRPRRPPRRLDLANRRRPGHPLPPGQPVLPLQLTFLAILLILTAVSSS